jgi:O-antigen ligase
VLVAALALSPHRYFLAPLALVAGLVFLRVGNAGVALLAFIPYAALLNLEPWLAGGRPYPSEVILLAGIAVAAFRSPQSFRFQGAARAGLAYGAWIALAALLAVVVAGRGGDGGAPSSEAVLRLVRIGFLAAALFALGQAAARSGRVSTWVDAATGAVGLIGFLAILESLLDLRHGGVPDTGSAVGGPELLALHLTLLAPPGIALCALGRDASRASRFLLALAALALGLSFSRAGWAGGWAAILGMGLLAGKVHRRGARLLLGAAGLLVALALVAAVLLGVAGGPLATYGERLRAMSPGELLASRSADWQKGLATIQAHPLFGQPDGPNPYNLFLGLAAESGMPTWIPWLAILALAAGAAWRAIRSGSALAPHAVGLLGAMIGLLVTGIGESSLGARLTPPAMVSLGLTAGLLGAERRSRPDRGGR